MDLPTVRELAAMLDHAVLKPTQAERDVVDACTVARRERIAAVVVKPFYVPVMERACYDGEQVGIGRWAGTDPMRSDPLFVCPSAPLERNDTCDPIEM